MRSKFNGRNNGIGIELIWNFLFGEKFLNIFSGKKLIHNQSVDTRLKFFKPTRHNARTVKPRHLLKKHVNRQPVGQSTRSGKKPNREQMVGINRTDITCTDHADREQICHKAFIHTGVLTGNLKRGDNRTTRQSDCQKRSAGRPHNRGNFLADIQSLQPEAHGPPEERPRHRTPRDRTRRIATVCPRVAPLLRDRQSGPDQNASGYLLTRSLADHRVQVVGFGA